MRKYNKLTVDDIYAGFMARAERMCIERDIHLPRKARRAFRIAAEITKETGDLVSLGEVFARMDNE
jgi:hypothetical protein